MSKKTFVATLCEHRFAIWYSVLGTMNYKKTDIAILKNLLSAIIIPTPEAHDDDDETEINNWGKIINDGIASAIMSTTPPLRLTYAFWLPPWVRPHKAYLEKNLEKRKLYKIFKRNPSERNKTRYHEALRSCFQLYQQIEQTSLT